MSDPCVPGDPGFALFVHPVSVQYFCPPAPPVLPFWTRAPLLKKLEFRIIMLPPSPPAPPPPPYPPQPNSLPLNAVLLYTIRFPPSPPAFPRVPEVSICPVKFTVVACTTK